MTETTESPEIIERQLAAWITALHLGNPRTTGELEIHPLIASNVPEAPWVLLHQAIAEKTIEVFEKANANVTEVLARNLGAAPILVVEGEILVGAKQNRVVTGTALIPAGATVPVAVGCVQQGRWHFVSPSFDIGAMPAEPNLRARHVEETASAGHHDQARLWSDVAASMRVRGVRSPSGDYVEAQAAHVRAVHDAGDEEARARAFDVVPGQVGVLVRGRDRRDGATRLLGIELLGAPGLWAAMAFRMMRSYFFGIGLSPAGGGAEPDPRGWLDEIARATIAAHPTAGLGLRLALRGTGIAGAGLWHEGRPAQLAVFPVRT